MPAEHALLPALGYPVFVMDTAGKDLAVHPFTGHAVPTAHVERQIRHLRDFLR